MLIAGYEWNREEKKESKRVRSKVEEYLEKKGYEVEGTEFGRVVTGEESYVRLMANAGSGKALPLWERVLTPDGLRCIGDLRVGDKVYTQGMEVGEVLGVYPQGKKVVWETEFVNGYGEVKKKKSCKFHLWSTVDGVVRTDRLKVGEVLVSAYNEGWGESEWEKVEKGLELKTVAENTLASYVQMCKERGICGYEVIKDKRAVRWVVKDVRELEQEEEMVCITVSGGTHTYVLEDYVVTHNTTTLLYRLANDIERKVKDGESVWVSTFSKGGAKELETRYAEMESAGVVRKGVSVRFNTLHAEFYRILKMAGVKLDIVGEEEIWKYLVEILNDISMGYRERDRLKYSDFETKQSVKTLVYYVRYNLGELPNADVYGRYFESGEHLRRVSAALVRRLDLLGKQDFARLEEMLYEALVAKPIKGLYERLKPAYDYVYLDEFQDTSVMQYEIVKALVKESKGVFVVGDTDQSIYQFRGSKSELLSKRVGAELGLVDYRLSKNYRCHSKIVDAAKVYVEGFPENTGRVYLADKVGGRVEKWVCDVGEMYDYIGESIKEDIEAGKRVGVLTRTGYDGYNVYRYLSEVLAEGVRLSVPSEGVRRGHYKQGVLVKLYGLVLDERGKAYQEAIKAIENLIKNRVSGRYTKLSKALEIDKVSGILGLSESTRALLGPEVTYYVRLLQSVLDSDKSVEDKVCNIYNYTGMMLRSQLQESVGMQRGLRKALQDLAYMLMDQLWGIGNLNEFITGESFLEDRLVSTDSDVEVSTIHESKGKEYDVVYLIDTPLWENSIDEYLNCTDEVKQEELKLMYVGVTRGKEKVVLVTDNEAQSEFARVFKGRVIVKEREVE